jgi:hypothetical protein
MQQSLVRGNIDIMRHIFEFDGTYRERFTDTVLVSVWRCVWEDYLRNLTDPYIIAVLRHLFEVWGVSKTNLATYQPNIQFCRRHYFPDRMNAFVHRNWDGSVNVLVYMQVNGQTTRMTRARVLTPEMYTDESSQEISPNDDIVYEDPDSGFVVCV